MIYTLIVCSLSLAVQVAGNGLSCGIIWYERNVPEVKRTLINRLISNHCAVNVVFNSVTLNTSILIFLLGSLREAFCDLVSVALFGLVILYLLNADAIIALRYLYICRFKNVGILNDDLVYFFLTLVTAVVSVYFAVLIWFCGFHHVPFWHRCVCRFENESEPEVKQGVENLRLFWALGVTSLGLHAALYSAIFCRERMVEANIAAAGAGGAAAEMQQHVNDGNNNYNNHNNYNTYCTGIAAKSFINVRTSLFALIFLVFTYILGHFIQTRIGHLLQIPVLDTSPVMLLWLVFTNSILIQGIYYWKNREMRQKIFNAFRAWLFECGGGGGGSAGLHSLHG